MQQMPAVIDDGDGHVPVVRLCVRLGGGGHQQDVFVGQYGFGSHLILT